jgi:hypothetical protein
MARWRDKRKKMTRWGKVRNRIAGGREERTKKIPRNVKRKKSDMGRGRG